MAGVVEAPVVGAEPAVVEEVVLADASELGGDLVSLAVGGERGVSSASAARDEHDEQDEDDHDGANDEDGVVASWGRSWPPLRCPPRARRWRSQVSSVDRRWGMDEPSTTSFFDMRERSGQNTSLFRG